MPLSGIGCPKCMQVIPSGEIVRHALTCGFAPPMLVELVYEFWCRDRRHDALKVTTTAFNDCPRRWLLTHLFPYDMPFDKLLPAVLGSALHEAVGRRTLLPTCPEIEVRSEECTCDRAEGEMVVLDGEEHASECGKVRCTFAGKVFGQEVSGRVDAYGWLRADPTRVKTWDWKTQSAFSEKYVNSVPRPEHKVQAYVNALLARQNGVNVVAAEIAVIPWSKCVVVPIAVPTDEATLLAELNALRPYEGDVSVAEIADGLFTALAAVEAGTDPAEVVTSLPAYGKRIACDGRGGSMCSKFCSVSSLCWRFGGERAPELGNSAAKRYAF